MVPTRSNTFRIIYHEFRQNGSMWFQYVLFPSQSRGQESTPWAFVTAREAYMRHIPLSRRSAVLKHNLKPEGQKFEVFCAEIFHTLEEQTSASALLESLGESSGEYKSLSTNSKSGEFFFLSHDRKFLIKTVSEAEGRLLFRMLPEYQDHIHSLPASLIVRFAGLYHVEVGNGSWKYFLVMMLCCKFSS